MKKGFAILMALTMLMALTACGTKKAEQTAPEQTPPVQEQPVEVPPELQPVKDVEIPAEVMDGRTPGGDYDLPEEVIPMQEWQWSGAVALLAEQDGAKFYAVEGKESSPALLCWDGITAEFDWQYVTPRAIEPELWVYDLDEDGEDELVVDCYGGSGTGVSLDYLYVVESDGETLTAYELPWAALHKAVDEQMQIVRAGDRVYAALGRELVDITEALGEYAGADVTVTPGQIVSYSPTETGLTCSIGVAAEGGGLQYLAVYVATVEGEIRYENGTFTLEGLNLRS